MVKAKAIPKGYHTVTPGFTIAGCANAIDFYKRALGAEELMRMPAPDGKSIWHAELKIGDSIVFMNDEIAGMTPAAPSADHPAPVGMWLYVANCDASFRRAVDAGAKVLQPVEDMFWGDRRGMVLDPFGYRWSFATHVKDMTEDEMRRAGEEFAKQMASGG